MAELEAAASDLEAQLVSATEAAEKQKVGWGHSSLLAWACFVCAPHAISVALAQLAWGARPCKHASARTAHQQARKQLACSVLTVPC